MYCDTYAFIQIIYLIKVILRIVSIALPIILIVRLTISLVKAIASNEDEMKKEINRCIKRIIYAVLIFFIPSIIGLSMNLIGQGNYKVAACWNEATYTNVTKAKSIKEINTIKNSVEYTDKSLALYIEKFEEDIDSEDIKKTEQLKKDLDIAYSNLDVEKATLLRKEFNAKVEEIRNDLKKKQWEEIEEKMPEIVEIVGSGVSSNGMQLVMAYEGNEGYCDGNKTMYSAKNIGDGTITAGYGVTNYDQALAISLGFGNYFPMKSGDCVPVSVLDTIFAKDYASRSDMVRQELAKYNLTWQQYQIDAVVSLAYNCGDSYISRLVRAYQEGGNQGIWDNGFNKCTKASNGNPIFNEGLMNRRKSEYNLFTTGNYNKGF